jgi:hypothetical protein
MTIRGAGDRWLAGDMPEGVTFALNDVVEITAGAEGGKWGTIRLLLGLRPEPLYLVELGSGQGDVRVRQSALRAVP